MRIVARDFRSSRWLELELAGSRFAEIRPKDGPAAVHDDDDWVAPAFWDLQTNGRWGHSFSSPELTIEHVSTIVRAQPALGTARLCPTLITAPVADLVHGL